MRIYCLSSIKKIPQIDGIQRCIVEEPESFKDEYTIQTMNSREMKKAEAYALTEIDIGYDFIRYTNYPISKNREEQIKVYWLCIYREDTSLIQVPMLPGTVTLVAAEGEKNVYVLTVCLSHIKFSYEKFDIILKIRCIKNTIVKGMISKSEEEQYEKFAEEIEAYPDGRENAFQNLHFSLQHETRDNALRTRMSDFKTLIELLCDPESGNVENVPSGKRYNQRSKCLLSERKYWIHKSQTKPRKETIKNEARKFRDCKKIDLTSAKLKDLDLETLESDNLERLWLTDIDLTEDIKTIIAYAKNINFSKLKDIDLNSCKTQILPDEIAEKLPQTMESILLTNSNITFIPKSISRLINLEQLHLDENEGLEENGIPWNDLPINLTSLSLEDKSITEIPFLINRLNKLKTLNVVSENLKTVHWKEICDKIEWLSIESKMDLNAMELSGKNNITFLSISCPFLKEIISFPTTTHLYLDNCGIKSFNCENNLRTLVELSIVENEMTDIAWDYLPVTLENLNLSKNKIKKVEQIGHLINLQELNLDGNKIEFISSDINELQNLKLVYLCNNKLTELPEGFENLRKLHDLRLSRNRFNYDEKFPEDLNNKLWKRLPNTLGQLVLNSNNLFKIPCCFRFSRLINFHVTGCNLHHICPRIYLQAQHIKRFSKTYCLSLDIRKNQTIQKNQTLTHFSFVPSIIFQPPSATEEKQKHDIINTFWLTSMEIATDNEKLRNTSKFPTKNFKPKYEFKESESQTFCDCCGVCGKTTKTEPLQKQNMVMDFMIAFTDAEDFDPFDKPKFEPGKWKSEIHTKMCSNCRLTFIEKTENAFKKGMEGNDENDVIEKRQKLPNENIPFISGLQNVPLKELQCLKLKNYDAIDCFLIAAVNVLDSMEELKTSIFKNTNPERKTQNELIKIFKQKIKSVRSLRETLTTFAKNEQEDAVSALIKLIESLDAASQKVIMFSYQSIETCLCEFPKFQNSSNCFTLPLTVGQESNKAITFNSMLSNWIKFYSYCSTCNSVKITEHNVQLGNLQQYLIFELNTMVKGPNEILVPCTVPLTNFNSNSHLIFGALWELISAIQYIGNGKSGHYITWRKKNNDGWIVINDDKIGHEKQLLPDLSNYRVLILKKLVVQIIANNDAIMETSCNNSDFVSVNEQNQDVYMPNQCFLQNQTLINSETIYSTPQNTLPPISSFVNHSTNHPSEPIHSIQYPSSDQQQLQPQPMPIFASDASYVDPSYETEYNVVQNPNTFGSTTAPSYLSPNDYSTPSYQAPHENHQHLIPPMSPMSSLINMSFNEEGNYIFTGQNALTNTNNITAEESEYMYYPENDDWTWKQHL